MNIPGHWWTLRVKLSFAPLLALVLAFSASWFLISGRVDRALLSNEDAQISLTSRILLELFQSRIIDSRVRMKALVVREELYEGYFTAKNEDNFKPLAEVLQQGMGAARAQDAFILRPDGEPMVRVNQQGPDYRPQVKELVEGILEHPPIADPSTELDDAVRTRLVSVGERLVLLTLGPLLDVEDIVGVVVFVREIDAPFAAGLKQDMSQRFFEEGAGVEVSLATAERVVVGTLTGLQPPVPLAAPRVAFDQSLFERPFRHLFLPLEGGEAFIGLSYDVSENASVRISIRNIMLLVFCSALALILTILLVNVNLIVGSVVTLVSYAKEIAQGNLTRKVAVKSRDEIGELFGAINTMSDGLAKTIRMVSLQSETVDVCVGELAGVKKTLAEDSRQTFEYAGDVVQANDSLTGEITEIREAVGQARHNMEGISEATRDLASEIEAIAVTSGQTASNVSTVAAAAEEMTANIAEISGRLDQVNRAAEAVSGSIQEMNVSFEGVRRKCEMGKRESGAAGEHVAHANKVMETLRRSAQEIGQVISLIDTITDQTNMLALNAAIEAAGAGKAGKGFAVVANEIKLLAQQTSKATSEIETKIEEIQTHVGDAVAANQEITQSIDQLEGAVVAITDAVDTQSSLTGEMVSNIKGVAESVLFVSQSARELEAAAQDVSRAAGEAANGTGHIAQVSAQAAGASREMLRKSSEAQEFVQTIQESTEVTSRTSLLVQDKMRDTLALAARMQGSVAHFEKLTTVVMGTSQALGEARAGLDVGQALFTVQDEKQFLLSWIGHLEQRIRGRAEQDSPQPMEKSDACSLGRWIVADGSARFKERSEFVELHRIHQQAHEMIEQAHAALARGEEEAAASHLAQLHPLRQHLFALLDRFYLQEAYA